MIPEGAAFGDHLPSPGGRWLGFAEPDEGDPAFPKNRAKMMGKPVGAAISRPPTFRNRAFGPNRSGDVPFGRLVAAPTARSVHPDSPGMVGCFPSSVRAEGPALFLRIGISYSTPSKASSNDSCSAHYPPPRLSPYL